MARKILVIALLFLVLGISSGCQKSPDEMAASEGLNDGTPPPNPVQPETILYTDPSGAITQRKGACTDLAESFTVNDKFKPISFTMCKITGVIYGEPQACNPLAPAHPGVVQMVYNGVVTAGYFQTIFRIVLTMYIAIYGLAVMVGIEAPRPNDFIMRVVKVGLVVAFLSPAGFTLFNDYVATFFITGTDYLIAEMTNAFSPGGLGITPTNPNGLVVLDAAFSRFFSARYWDIFLAMLLTGSWGFAAGLLMFITSIIYLWAILMALQLYIISLIARSLLLAIAPIFLIFLLFGYTRSLFEGWLKQMINFSIQPVMVFAFLAFFNGLIMGLFTAAFQINGLKICYYNWVTLRWGQLIASVVMDPIKSLMQKFLEDNILNKTVPVLNITMKDIFNRIGISDIIQFMSDYLDAHQADIASAIDSAIPELALRWWSFFKKGNVPLKHTDMLSDIPIPLGMLVIIAILVFLCYRMGQKWPKTVAEKLSEGLIQLPGSVGGLGDVYRGATGAVKETAGVLGSAVNVATKPLRFVTRGLFGR